MKKLAWMLALCLATQANAATYYIRSGGSNSNAGTTNSDGGAWQTLAKANTTVQPGDVVQVISLTASDTTSGVLLPAMDGTPTAWITYIGNPASPLTFGLADVRLSKSYVSIKGFRSRNRMAMAYTDEGHKPYYDSLSY